MENKLNENKGSYNPSQNECGLYDPKLENVIWDIEEYNMAKNLTGAEIERIILVHYMYKLSTKKICNILGISRDRYYATIKKASATSGIIDYIELTKLVEVASHKDEEW
jgi:DNA-directed RNA polymerase specialized sigma subunit